MVNLVIMSKQNKNIDKSRNTMINNLKRRLIDKRSEYKHAMYWVAIYSVANSYYTDVNYNNSFAINKISLY